MKKIKLSQFIGRQLSRFKLGQAYYMLFMSTVSALSLVSLAFPFISILILIILLPIIILGAFCIGYFMDKSNITSSDTMKTIEMQNRYLNTVDEKNNDFRMLQMETMFEWIDSLQKNKPVDRNILSNKYKKFKKKWKQPSGSE